MKETETQRTERLAQLYRDVFGSISGSEVLMDLLDVSGFFSVSGMAVTGEQRAYCDGARSVLSHILGHVTKSEREMVSLKRISRESLLEDAGYFDN